MKKLIILLAILSFVFLPVYVLAAGHSGNTPPGQSGSTPPGQSGNSPGQSGNTPGQSGNTPGQSGSTPPGQSGSTPGQGSSDNGGGQTVNNGGGGQTGSQQNSGPTPEIIGILYDPQIGSVGYQFKQ